MNRNDQFKESAKQLYKLVKAICIVFGIIALFLIYLLVDPNFSAFRTTNDSEEYTAVAEEQSDDYDKIENGIHVRTGFVKGNGLMLVVNNCTNCHSAKLVTQNRMSKEGWESTIKWMQETQNLWDLGVNEETIVNYLATYYAPEAKGRRQNLNAVEWYELEQ